MRSKLFSISDTEKSNSFYTPWSFVHLLAGMVLSFFFNIYFNAKISLILSLVIHTIYELRDYYKTYHLKKARNSLFNSVGDTIASLIGMLMAIFMNIKGTKNKVIYLVIIHLINSILIQLLLLNKMEISDDNI